MRSQALADKTICSKLSVFCYRLTLDHVDSARYSAHPTSDISLPEYEAFGRILRATVELEYLQLLYRCLGWFIGGVAHAFL